MSGASARAANVLSLPARGRTEAPSAMRAARTERPPVLDVDDGLDDPLDHELDDAADLERRATDADADADADEERGAQRADEPFDAEANERDGPDAAPRSRAGLPGRTPAAAAAASADDATLAQWIERIARQDERALEALYDATSARLNGLVRRLTQRAALAEEVLEETYWQVWREAPRFDAARGRPLTWLLAMARSRAIDALRRERRFRHEALPEEGEGDAAALADAAALSPQDLLAATREHAHVHAALASLEPRTRQLVALAFLRGLTHEEIAAQQGMPLGSVKSLIRRALQQLRRVMEAEHA